jgi:hypothetical protein
MAGGGSILITSQSIAHISDFHKAFARRMSGCRGYVRVEPRPSWRRAIQNRRSRPTFWTAAVLATKTVAVRRNSGKLATGSSGRAIGGPAPLRRTGQRSVATGSRLIRRGRDGRRHCRKRLDAWSGRLRSPAGSANGMGSRAGDRSSYAALRAARYPKSQDVQRRIHELVTSMNSDPPA